MVVGWETTSLSSVEVGRVVSAIVQVDFGLEVGVQGFKQSIPGAFLLFFANLVRFVLGIILLEQLLVCNWVIAGALFDHGGLWLQIWSSVVLVLKRRIVSVCIREHYTCNHHGQC